jgi:hypothetical protein
MYRHPNHLDAKKNLEKDTTKLLRYYVLPKWHAGMSPQGGISKSSVRPRLQEDAVPRRALQAGRDFKNGVQTYGPNLYSLIKPKNSLIARFHSLLGDKKYPVRSGRELASKTLNMLRKFKDLPAPHPAAERNSLYFPG